MKLIRALALVPWLCVPFACDDDDDGYAEQTGFPCRSPAECYPDVADPTLLQGAVQCLSEYVQGGYCTHLCETDADCCAVEGECRTGIAQVCAPLESAGARYCFLSCETADLDAAGYPAGDESGYCNYYAGGAFGCRSSGGGSDNRKVCLP